MDFYIRYLAFVEPAFEFFTSLTNMDHVAFLQPAACTRSLLGLLVSMFVTSVLLMILQVLQEVLSQDVLVKYRRSFL